MRAFMRGLALLAESLCFRARVLWLRTRIAVLLAARRRQRAHIRALMRELDARGIPYPPPPWETGP